MTRVVAAHDLPQGCLSYDISAKNLSSKVLNLTTIKVKINAHERLTSNEDDNLIQSIKWSEDIHNCNVILERGILEQSVRLRTTKNITNDEELIMWFSPDLLIAMDIPFLSPANILGEKNYTCHRCHQIFEFPNPLKLHLSLNCNTLKVRELWQRLKTELTLSTFGPTISHRPEFIFQLSLKRKKSNERDKLSNRKENYQKSPSPVFSSYSSPSPDRLCSDLPTDSTRPSSEPPRNSAFKPYLNVPLTTDEIISTISMYDTESRFRREIIERTHVEEHANKEYINQRAAEIETFVSNMGQSKQGHLCLYCGKIYSRKYGLKIHIRTHTGFKPLKCKYCLRPFGDPSNLNKHVRLHAETDTPYRCHLCGKLLVRRRDLERHLKSRHDVEST